MLSADISSFPWSSPLAATTAIRSLHGKPFKGREIRLDDATSLSKRRKEKAASEGFARREAQRQAENDRKAAEASLGRVAGSSVCGGSSRTHEPTRTCTAM